MSGVVWLDGRAGAVVLAADLFSKQGLWVVLLGAAVLLPFAFGFWWLLRRKGGGQPDRFDGGPGRF